MSGGRIEWWPPAGAGELELPALMDLELICDGFVANREDLRPDQWWSDAARHLLRGRGELALGSLAAWPADRNLLSPADVHWAVGCRLTPSASRIALWAACGAGDVLAERCFVPSSLGGLERWWTAEQAYGEIAPPVACPRCLAMQAEGRSGLEGRIVWPELPLEAANA